jgi:hypothetical protein
MDLPRISYRPTLLHAALAGAAIALVGGVLVGGYFKSGGLIEGPSPQFGLLTLGEAAAEPVSFMTDASGKIPDYVLGTDFVAPPDGFAPLERTAWAEAPLSYEASPAEPSPVIEPAAWSNPPPPSVGGDIMAMAHREAAEAAPAAPPVSLEDRSDPAAFRAARREPAPEAVATETVVAAAY